MIAFAEDPRSPPLARRSTRCSGVGLLHLAWITLFALVLAVTGCRRETPTPVPTFPPLTTVARPTRPLMPTLLATVTATAHPTPSPPSTATGVATASATPGRTETASPSAQATPLPTMPSQPALMGTITVGQLPEPGHSPGGMALLGHDLYVANRTSDNVSIIVEGAVRHVVPVAENPSAIVADPESGRVFVLSGWPKVITVLQSTSQSGGGADFVATWPLPDRAETLALVGKELWVGTTHGSILVLSPQDGSVREEIALSAQSTVFAIAVEPQGKTAYAATYGRTHVIDVLAHQESATATPNSYQTLGISPDGKWLYMNDYHSSEGQFLAVLDAASLQVVKSIPIPRDPGEMAVDPGDGRIYLLSTTTDQLIVLDGESHDRLASILVGRRPSHLSLDASAGRLYVANADGDSVTMIDTDPLVILDTMPLAMNLTSMDVDQQSGKVYVAVSSSDRVLVVEESGVVDQWFVGRHPSAVRFLPQAGLVAVLSSVQDRLTLFDQTGQPTMTYATGANPQGLMFDPDAQKLYAGDTVIDRMHQLTSTLSVTTIYPMEYPPVQIVLDTRRNILYAVADNGTPGSNAGYVVRRFVEGEFSLAAPAPGRLSVIDLVYDEGMDRFYATNWRIDSFGLQVSDGEDCRETLYLRLNRYPAAMLLSPATHHLWVALHPSPWWSAKTRDTLLVAYDTRTLGKVAEFRVDGLAKAMAIDRSNDRLYLGGGTNTIHVIQDVAMAPPPAPTTTPSPTPWPTATPTPTCAAPVDSSLQAAWEWLGGLGGLGCSQGPAEEGNWVLQPFERGETYWRGAGATIFVALDDGTYLTYADDWREGMPSLACEASPPPGLYQPVRGFGLVWCRELIVSQALGWAREPERSFGGIYQEFTRGALLLKPDGRILVFRVSGLWTEWPDGH